MVQAADVLTNPRLPLAMMVARANSSSTRSDASTVPSVLRGRTAVKAFLAG